MKLLTRLFHRAKPAVDLKKSEVTPAIQKQLDNCDAIIETTKERIDELKKRKPLPAEHIAALERQVTVVEQKKKELTS
jgi:hypothetical protein